MIPKQKKKTILDFKPEEKQPQSPKQEQKQQQEVYAGNIVDIGGGRTGRVQQDGTIVPQAFRTLTEREQGEITNIDMASQGKLSAKQAQEQKQQQEAQRQQLQERQASIEAPQQQDLQPVTGTPLSNVPIFGAGLDVGAQIIDQMWNDAPFIGAVRKRAREKLGLPIESSQEILKNQAMTEIERREYEKGLTWSEKTGALIEGLHAGGLLRNFGVTSIETPTGNIKELEQSISQLTTIVREQERLARRGDLNPQVLAQNIALFEEQIERAEARIRLLINYSPQMRYSSDEVYNMELSLFRAKQNLFITKNNFAITQTMGANADPSLYSIYEEAING